MSVRDPFGDWFFEGVAVELERLSSLPALSLPAALRPVVHRTLLVLRPDGSWPEAALLQEALRAYVELVDTSLYEQGVTFEELAAEDRRWLDACRQCTQSLTLFEDMLTDLRADVPFRAPNVDRFGDDPSV